MIFPIRTDYRRRHTPWVNYLLLAANIILFVIGYRGDSLPGMQRIDQYMLDPQMPMLYQFVTSTFLHASWGHLLGNMVFLWVFGNAMNDKFGHAGYLAFYLAGGVLAGVGYLLLAGNAPVLGASGAIAAVTGAYLVLLPRTRITLIVFLYFIWPIEISSLLFIAFQFCYDMLMTLQGWTGSDLIASGGVAYAAHATGYLFGIGVAFLLLATKLLPRDDFDLLYILKQMHRRRQFQKMVANGYDPFRGVTNTNALNRDSHTPPPLSMPPEQLELRRGIADACAGHRLPEATALYRKLEAMTDNPLLGRAQQFDVANQLMAEQDYGRAAVAYERFVQAYGNYDDIGDIYLMLGLIYSRYIPQYHQALECLEAALKRLTDSNKRELAMAELEAVAKKMPSA